MANGLASKIVRWIDRDLVESYRPASLFAPPLVIGLIAVAIRGWSGLEQTLILTLLIAVWIPWLGVVLWRGWRLFKASGKRGDRHYDRTDKFALPPEYADTESATAARTRRKLLRRKA